ncbi:hypothetical protein [Slackia isoflavoniconvertens]|uniref:hypothetical protein n=1 Tax=Slackia isoflavoniconvertens TaxID=572010 RepID=UPI003AF0931E
MLEEVLRNLNNWFEVPGKRLTGFFQVEGGALTLPDGWLLDGQYFLVSGSVMNDGLHQWPAYDLVDEGFEGEVQALAVPMAVQDLADRIETWWEKYGKAAESPYQSESFGGYTYTKASGNGSQGGSQGRLTWRDAFRSELNRWRKL